MKIYKVKKIKRKINGFTLIELIVVVTIIAILSVVAIVNYGGASKKSRDGRRMADLEKARIALELYRQENRTYPALETDLAPDYIQQWPVDPTSFQYEYSRLTNYTYVLSAHMEDLGSTTITEISGCGGTCNYQTKNP
jgi:general secretion pathway protein G